MRGSVALVDRSWTLTDRATEDVTNSVMEHVRSGPPRWALVVLALLAVLAGCRSVTLRPPEAAYLYRPSSDVEIPLEVTAYRIDSTVDGSHLAARSQQELANADELDRLGQDRSVDVYYRATLHAALALQVAAFPSAEGQTAWQVYHRGLAGLIDAGQRYGRLDPRGQLTLREGSRRVIPINYYGFSWLPGDFDQLALAERFRSRDITNHHASEDWGWLWSRCGNHPPKMNRFFVLASRSR